MTTKELRNAALEEWIEKHNARCVWEMQPHGNLLVSGYRVRASIVIVTMYGPDGCDGFDLYTASGSIDIGETFADAETRIGLGSGRGLGAAYADGGGA